MLHFIGDLTISRYQTVPLKRVVMLSGILKDWGCLAWKISVMQHEKGPLVSVFMHTAGVFSVYLPWLQIGY